MALHGVAAKPQIGPRNLALGKPQHRGEQGREEGHRQEQDDEHAGPEISPSSATPR